MILVKSLLFITSSICALWISFYFSEKAYKNNQIKQILACSVLFPLSVSVSIFISALFGVLYFYVPAVFLVFSGALVALHEKRNAHSEILKPGEESNPSFKKPVFILFMLVLFVSGLFFGGFIYKGTCFGGDDFSYHPDFIIGLVTQHNLSICSTSYAAHFPFNAEIYASSYVLPFSQDGMAGLAGFYWLGLLCVIFLYWGHIWSFTKWAFIFGLSIILLTPNIQHAIATYTAVDLAAPVMMLASVVFILPHSGKTETKQMDFIFSGLCAGFAVGCKVTMVFLAGCLVLAVLWNQRKQNWKPVSYSIGILLSCILIAGGFSYIRNLLLTGNPIFPASIGPIEGPFGKAQQNATKLLFWILRDPMNGENWKIILNAYTNWPTPFFLISLAGYCLSLKCSLVKNNCDKNLLFVRRLLFWMGALLVILYPVIPFSGSPNSPDAPLALSIRYLLISYIIGVILFLTAIRKDGRINSYIYIAIFAVICIRFGFRSSKIAVAIMVLCASWITITFYTKYRGWILKYALNKKIMTISAAGFLCGILVFFPKHQKLTDQRVFYFKGDKMADVLETMEKLFSDKTRLCLFGVNYQTYPFWGRRFQLRLVNVDINGRARDTYYREWKEHPEEAVFWGNKKPEFTPAILVDNLIKNKVDCVITSKQLTDKWPEQQSILQTDKRVRKVYDDGMSCIWEIDKKSADSCTQVQ